jgi:hypothetical protein
MGWVGEEVMGWVGDEVMGWVALTEQSCGPLVSIPRSAAMSQSELPGLASPGGTSFQLLPE